MIWDLSYPTRNRGIDVVSQGLYYSHHAHFIYVLRLGEVKTYPEVVILYQIILKQLSVISTTPSRLLTYINPSHDQGAKQWVRVLLLFLLFVPCVFDGHDAT